MKLQSTFTRILAILLALSICGTAELAQAAQNISTEPVQQQSTAPSSNVPASNTPAPDQAVPATDSTTQTPAAELPNAPSATAPAQTTPAQDQTSSSASQQNSQQSSQQSQAGNSTQQQQPLGTAAAEKGVSRGGAASRPAGNALAGTKQRQSRSLLIKLGAVAAAGVALGVIYGLTRGAPSVPPGAAH
jgi:cobalamin biosynthesis Mg chelatase CobN